MNVVVLRQPNSRDTLMRQTFLPSLFLITTTLLILPNGVYSASQKQSSYRSSSIHRKLKSKASAVKSWYKYKRASSNGSSLRNSSSPLLIKSDRTSSANRSAHQSRLAKGKVRLKSGFYSAKNRISASLSRGVRSIRNTSVGQSLSKVSSRSSKTSNTIRTPSRNPRSAPSGASSLSDSSSDLASSPRKGNHPESGTASTGTARNKSVKTSRPNRSRATSEHSISKILQSDDIILANSQPSLRTRQSRAKGTLRRIARLRKIVRRPSSDTKSLLGELTRNGNLSEKSIDATIAERKPKSISKNAAVPKYVYRAIVVDETLDQVISRSGHLSGSARERIIGQANSNPANPALPDSVEREARVKQQVTSTPFPRDADIVSTSIHPEIAISTALKTGARGGLAEGKFIRLDKISTEGLAVEDVERIVLAARPKSRNFANANLRTLKTPLEPPQPNIISNNQGIRANTQRPTEGGRSFSHLWGGVPRLRSVLTPEEVAKVKRHYPEGEYAVMGSIPPGNIEGSHRINPDMLNDEVLNVIHKKAAALETRNKGRISMSD